MRTLLFLGIFLLSKITLGLVSTDSKINALSAVPGEFVVALESGDGAKFSVSKVIKNFGASVKFFDTDSQLMVVKLRNSVLAENLNMALRNISGVRYVEPNLIYSIQGSSMAPVVSGNTPKTPNDKYFWQLWGLYNYGQKDHLGNIGSSDSDIGAMKVWEKGIVGDGKMLVAVIDTGISWDHEDLKGNIFTNIEESGDKASNGIDDDGNGFVDDLHGWDFFSNTPNSNDLHNHGTHCAGTIGAKGNNKVGVAGVNWNVSLLPIRFLNEKGNGTLEGAVNSINYARLMGVKIMSNSWGGYVGSMALKEAIEKAREAGILFIAAAGNDGMSLDGKEFYPAGYDIDNIISVGATDNQDNLAIFSNYSSTRVHVTAPGLGIYSTMKTGYGYFSGTSMATPHVAGAAALLWSVHPNLKYREIKERLISSSKPVESLRRKSISHGRLSLSNAIEGKTFKFEEPDPSQWKDVAIPVIESPHPYTSKQNYRFEVRVPGAKFIRVVIDKYEVENLYDWFYIEDMKGNVVDKIWGEGSERMTDFATGDSLVLGLKTDYSQDRWGFRISRVHAIY